MLNLDVQNGSDQNWKIGSESDNIFLNQIRFNPAYMNKVEPHRIVSYKFISKKDSWGENL